MDRPDVRELECFVAVGEELNFSRAARRLHVSQPPLSRRIRRLEEKLGAALFTRNSRAVELTRAGAAFLEDARFLLRHLDRAVDTVRKVGEGRALVLNLGFIGAMLENNMVNVLRGFRAEHPDCQVRLHDLSSPELIAAVERSELDGAFVAARPPDLPRALAVQVWKSDFLNVALPPDHRLAAKAEIALADLAEENWVMIGRASAPFFHRQVVQLCLKAGFRPKILEESPKMPAVLAMVAVGEGISVIYEAMSAPAANVVIRPLKPRTSIPHAFIYRTKDPSPALNHLIDALRRRGRHPGKGRS